MSLKAELEIWANALKAYDEEDFEQALTLFSRIADSSKILTNMGLIYATLGEHEAAVEQFVAATGLDQYLAVAYFQCGVSNFLLGRYEPALKDFEEALLYLRGNQAINYEQLGLKFKLFSAEILFNKGLSQIYLGKNEQGLADMEEARREKATEEHNVIDDAIQDRGEGYTVFSIPVGVLYRPSETKLKNAKTKDYMGKAKLVAASDATDTYTTFTGVTRLKAGITPAGIFVDKPEEGPNLSRSVTMPPAPKNVVDDLQPKKAALARANTTLNVPSDARERIAGLRAGGPLSAGLTRSASSAAISPRRSPLAGTADGPPASANPSNRNQDEQNPNKRLTEFYNEYLDSYEDEAPPPLPSGNNQAVAAWARSNANPAYRGSRGPPMAPYAPSSVGGGSVRRKLTRRVTARQRYEEEEEGYVSGEYEDGPFELVKIRVKLHYGDDVRGMALTPETHFDEFLDRVVTKFGKNLVLKFKDEDGGKVSLRDESDYELAIETARESAKGKPEGKLEIWCEEA